MVNKSIPAMLVIVIAALPVPIPLNNTKSFVEGVNDSLAEFASLTYTSCKMKCDSTQQCGTVRSLLRRKAAAEAALKRKQAFIADLEAEIEAHTCKAGLEGASVPSVDLNSFGTFNQRELVECIYGGRFAPQKYAPNGQLAEDFTTEINLALERLPEMERFVLELRMRGVTLERASQIIGWKSRERVRQVEARAFRHLRDPARSGELRAKAEALWQFQKN